MLRGDTGKYVLLAGISGGCVCPEIELIFCYFGLTQKQKAGESERMTIRTTGFHNTVGRTHCLWRDKYTG